MSNTGAGDAEFIFLRVKSLGVDRLKIMSSRDLAVEIMVWNCCVERFRFIDGL